MTAPALPQGYDPTDPHINEVGLPFEEFAELRATAPVFFVEQSPEAYAGFENAPGYWAVTKHADVLAVSRSKDFSTNENGAIIRFAPDMTREQAETELPQRADVQQIVGGKPIAKVIFVPGRLCNLIVK